MAQQGSRMKAIVGDTPQFERKYPVGARHFSSTNAEKRPWIAIEGPLRVGKSTLSALLAERIGAARIAEPENNPFLPRFHAGEPGMAFAAQMWFLRQRVAQLETVARRRSPVVSLHAAKRQAVRVPNSV